MESPSSTVRRRAWINSSRQWPTLEEHDGEPCSLPSASIADDDVFSEGCISGKIETWLNGCGSEPCSKGSGQLSFESVLQANNISDDLTLGADAFVLSGGEITPERGLARHPSLHQQYRGFSSSTPRQGLCPLLLDLGQSMASSCFSSSTWKTTSSVSEVLQMCSEDAEETLYELGFGCEEPQVAIRIPPRFLTFPSQAKGINFRRFLESQLRRIREEDPSISLASRFRQVQVLTAMANVFYSLYSHVSRTPLPKLDTPEFNFPSNSVEGIERFRSSIRSEPRSPVERLKDTVNKMCLYTGSPRGSDSTSPQASPRKRSSLPEVVDIVLKVKTEATMTLDLEESNPMNSDVDVSELNTEDILHGGNKISHEEKQDNKHKDDVDSDVKQTAGDGMTPSSRTSVASSLSGETVIEAEHQLLSCQSVMDSCLTQSDTRTAEIQPVAKVTYDLISSQIVESVHQAPFCCQNTHSLDSFPPVSSSSAAEDKPHIQTTVSEPDEDRSTQGDDESKSLHVLDSKCSLAPCRITVTGWEGDSASLCPTNTPDSGQHASPVPFIQTCEESFSKGEWQYLNPLTHRSLGPLSSNLQQVNSFELEEVHSAGEEDFGQPETETSPSSKKHQYKGEVVRGDSMQSDSSGYADEEVSPLPGRHSR
ncbi:protein ITPRID2 [Parambassis ranga]|uniref:Protein ITPRID2 n=1 Tax=Parambassis ranga TaxID=210632 RepID=A0A6P7I7Y5_9TELE|nr:protein TESPA1 [Parambassis ranga]